MRITFRILSGALIALCWVGLANADPQVESRRLDPSAIRAITNVTLDAACENFVARATRPSSTGLADPNTMVCIEGCQTAGIPEPIEICVVTTNGPTQMIPAAPAQR